MRCYKKIFFFGILLWAIYDDGELMVTDCTFQDFSKYLDSIHGKAPLPSRSMQNTLDQPLSEEKISTLHLLNIDYIKTLDQFLF